MLNSQFGIFSRAEGEIVSLKENIRKLEAEKMTIEEEYQQGEDTMRKELQQLEMQLSAITSQVTKIYYARV